VTGQVKLYVILDPSLYGPGTTAITITSGSYVNDQSDYCAANIGAAGCTPTPDLPSAQSFEVFSNTTGSVGGYSGSGYWLGGILYAPTASLTQDGCKSVYYGSLIISTLTCDGGPHLTINYDNALQTVYGPWFVSGYTQISPSLVSIP
jgi:hypothetical protein